MGPLFKVSVKDVSSPTQPGTLVTTPKYLIMPDISINTNGVLKLLQNLKVDKAAGPDEIKPIVLKELGHEILDLVSLIF
ncbi:hypothetical protein ACF0H5_001972 [Mactra antiquata]